MTGYVRITQRRFYALGGFANPRLVRLSKGRVWAYYERTD